MSCRNATIITVTTLGTTYFLILTVTTPVTTPIIVENLCYMDRFCKEGILTNGY